MIRIFFIFGVTAILHLSAARSPFIINYPSQFGQDKWVVEDVFKLRKNGFFIDIGAHDGEYYSNTFILEKCLNWTGICIEPNPQQYAALINNRGCINLNVCLDYTDHEVDFRYDNNLFAGIVDHDTDNNPERRKEQLEASYENGGIIRMMTKTLVQVLDECNAPHVIDFMSIDVEGAETRILRNFPFEKYIFLAIVIERPSPELNRILEENGYVFVKNDICDTYYVHSTINNFETIIKEQFTQISTNPGA